MRPYEAVVTQLEGFDMLYARIAGSQKDVLLYNSEVEKIAPAPGSVVLCKKMGYHLFLTSEGWRTEYDYRTATDRLSDCSGEHEVIFDAGAK